MRRSGTGSGGGHGSKNVVHKPVRTGSGSHSTRQAGAGQIGLMWGNKVTHQKGTTNYKGEKLHNLERNFQRTPFGNEVAAKTRCGPGGSRQVMGSGSQGQHGAVAGSPRPAGRGILTNE